MNDDVDMIENLKRVHSNRLIDAMYRRLVMLVIDNIRSLPPESQQSGDSGLKDVWEEYMYQVQREESVFYELYQEFIRDFCRSQVNQLERERQDLLWVWNEGFFNWDWDDDYKNFPDAETVEAALEDELFRRVHQAAMDEPLEYDPDENCAIQGIIDDEHISLRDDENDPTADNDNQIE